ncbi:unnamed protein product [Danaus chrysippus]|uniref:(African queen) hypothetical protein n=1 Tax=Danaus chrysippus TaxID=151541 RepID=A0A8J2R524_9NEOP|nr:unnamed protein product [Danaus chrysippus]
MLAVVLLGLLACEGIASYKFERIRDYDRETGIFNGRGYDSDFMSLNRHKEYIFKRKRVINREITSISRQKEVLERRLEYLHGHIEYLDREIERIDNEIEKLVPIDDYSSNDGQRTADNVYTLIMSLPGYKEEEITLNARKGLLEIDAFHVSHDKPLVSYTFVKHLPDDVDPNGYWSYSGGVLRVNFPIQQNGNIISTKYISSLKNKVNTDSGMIYNKQTSTEKNFLHYFDSHITSETEKAKNSFAVNNGDVTTNNPLFTNKERSEEIDDNEENVVDIK